MNDLQTIKSSYDSITGDIVRIAGTKDAPLALADEGTLGTAIELVTLLRDLSRHVEAYYKQPKADKKAEWQAVIDEEKRWLEPIDRARAFVDERVREYNARIRAEREAEERRLAEQRAAEERARLEKEQEAAAAAGNEQVFEAIEEEKKTIIAEPVTPIKVKSSTEFASQSEQETIDDFIILDHTLFAQALIDTGNGNCIDLSSKTITAFKKILLKNRGMKAFPGVQYRRDYKTSYRGK